MMIAFGLMSLVLSSCVMLLICSMIVDAMNWCWSTMYLYWMCRPPRFRSINYIVVPVDRIRTYLWQMMNMDLSHPIPSVCKVDWGIRMDCLHPTKSVRLSTISTIVVGSMTSWIVAIAVVVAVAVKRPKTIFALCQTMTVDSMRVLLNCPN